jgi:hypothetical protein
MTDPFFTRRNEVDTALVEGNISIPVADMILEAVVRRLAESLGTMEAAIRVQRLADMCAGANVMPIDHWRSETVAATAPKRSGWRLTSFRVSPVALFWLGFFIGCWVGGQGR